jgi:hypothetical protein
MADHVAGACAPQRKQMPDFSNALALINAKTTEDAMALRERLRHVESYVPADEILDIFLLA